MKFKNISLSLLTSLTVGCANFPGVDSLDSLSVDSISDVQNVATIPDIKPKIGNIDITQASSAALDIGKAAMISEEEIAQMALGYAKHSDTTNKIAQNGSSYMTRLAKITSKHKSEDGLNLNFKVYISKQINAFALADGSVRVYSGLMDLMTDDELISIIGHEIGHVKLGHSADRIRLANVTSGIRKGVGSTSTIAGVVANDSLLGGVVEKVINSQFSQSQETDSDEYGVQFMKKHSYKLDAAITSFNKLAELDGESSFVDGLLSSHPASTDRAKHLAELIGEDSNIQVVASQNDSETKTLAKNEVGTEGSAENSKQAALKTQAPDEVKTSYQQQAPQAATTTKAHSLTPGWYVQIAAETEINSAENLENKLNNFGFDATLQSAIVNGVKYFRVLVGPFKQQDTANRSKEMVVEKMASNEEPFIRFLK